MDYKLKIDKRIKALYPKNPRIKLPILFIVNTIKDIDQVIHLLKHLGASGMHPDPAYRTISAIVDGSKIDKLARLKCIIEIHLLFKHLTEQEKEQILDIHTRRDDHDSKIDASHKKPFGTRPESRSSSSSKKQ